jgi:hypothetical protein
MTTPAGAEVDAILPGDAIVALAGSVGHRGTLRDMAVRRRMLPTIVRNRRVGECVMGDNSPLHT